MYPIFEGLVPSRTSNKRHIVSNDILTTRHLCADYDVKLNDLVKVEFILSQRSALQAVRSDKGTAVRLPDL
jgi:hypothetical protein